VAEVGSVRIVVDPSGAFCFLAGTIPGPNQIATIPEARAGLLTPGCKADR
jgi:hypothetical protein